MSTTALEKIAAIEAEAKRKIETLKQEAVSELVKRIAELKSELAGLETEYATLTGRTFKGEKVVAGRKRLSREEKEALVVQVTEVIRQARNGASFGQIAKETSASASAVRDAIKQVQGLRKTGSKASTRYFLK